MPNTKLAQLEKDINNLSSEITDLDSQDFVYWEKLSKEPVKERRATLIFLINDIRQNLTKKREELRTKLTEKAEEIIKTSPSPETEKISENQIKWQVKIEAENLWFQHGVFFNPWNPIAEEETPAENPAEQSDDTASWNEEYLDQWQDHRNNQRNSNRWTAENTDGTATGATSGNSNGNTSGKTDGMSQWFHGWKNRWNSVRNSIRENGWINNIQQYWVFSYEYATQKPLFATGWVFVAILAIYLTIRVLRWFFSLIWSLFKTVWQFFFKKTGRPETIKLTAIRSDDGRFTKIKKEK